MKRTLTVLVLLTACALLLLMGAALVEGPVLLMPPRETELPPAAQPLLARAEGLPAEKIRELLQCVSCDDGLRILQEEGICEQTLDRLVESIDKFYEG